MPNKKWYKDIRILAALISATALIAAAIIQSRKTREHEDTNNQVRTVIQQMEKSPGGIQAGGDVVAPPSIPSSMERTNK